MRRARNTSLVQGHHIQSTLTENRIRAGAASYQISGRLVEGSLVTQIFGSSGRESVAVRSARPDKLLLLFATYPHDLSRKCMPCGQWLGERVPWLQSDGQALCRRRWAHRHLCTREPMLGLR